jgi:hypothetical protein
VHSHYKFGRRVEKFFARGVQNITLTLGVPYKNEVHNLTLYYHFNRLSK